MKKAKTFVAVFLFGLTVFSGRVQCAEVELRVEKLGEALKLLRPDERPVVDQAVEQIKKGMHTAALATLSSLSKANPDNSSLRILTAYALLQAGNLVGAFDEAKKAEAAPNGNSYKCWFLAKVALLAGDQFACKREVGHLKKDGDMAAVKALEKELRKNN